MSISLYVAPKGHNKTKTLLKKMQLASDNTTGNVVCVFKKVEQDISLSVPISVRLIDAADYELEGDFSQLYTFLCGIMSMDYDITNIFIDGTLRIAYPDGSGKRHLEEMVQNLLEPLAKISDKREIHIGMTVSCKVQDIPEDVEKYCKIRNLERK